MAESEEANTLHSYDKVRAIDELFVGRFDEEEIRCLLRKHDEDLSQTVNFILTSEPHELRLILQNEIDSWTMVERREHLRQQRQELMMRAQHGQIDTNTRQFSCSPCDRFWWRRVSRRKQVSRCDMCRVRYEPVPTNREWGIGEFRCTHCGNQFRGWGQMTLVASPCFKCGTPVYPSCILPPSRQTRPRRQQHACLAPDCYNRNRFHPNMHHQGLHNVTCVHPLSRRQNNRPAVVFNSAVHISSGSTVDTFLPQNGLDVENIFDYNHLPLISEDDESD